MFKKYGVGLVLACLALAVIGCGDEGPLGNTPPQGRPDWMKKDNTPPATPDSPRKQ